MATTVAVGILALEGFGLYCEVKAFYDYTQDGDEEALFKGVALGFLFLGAGKVLEKGFRALKGIKGIKTRLPRTKGSWKGKPGDETLKTDAFSAYNWGKFGFKTIDGGDEYIYDIKDIRKENTTASNFIKTLWKTLQVTNDEVLDIFELNAAYKTLETQHEVAKIVCSHKSEWAYKSQEIADEITKFYDFLIAEEKPEVKADLEKLKNLMWWNEAKENDKNYKPPVKEEETPKPKFDIGVDQNYALTPNTADSTATTPTTETETKPKAKDQPPKRMFPKTNIAYHFHPIA